MWHKSLVMWVVSFSYFITQDYWGLLFLKIILSPLFPKSIACSSADTEESIRKTEAHLDIKSRLHFPSRELETVTRFGELGMHRPGETHCCTELVTFRCSSAVICICGSPIVSLLYQRMILLLSHPPPKSHLSASCWWTFMWSIWGKGWKEMSSQTLSLWLRELKRVSGTAFITDTLAQLNNSTSTFILLKQKSGEWVLSKQN